MFEFGKMVESKWEISHNNHSREQKYEKIGKC